MNAVFAHFERCPCATRDEKLIMGDNLSSVLRQRQIKLPSKGIFKDLFEEFSEDIHRFNVLKTDFGKVIVPHDLPAAEKRFYIRFLMASNEEVVICGVNGFRPPEEAEVVTPPTTPPK